MRRIGTAKLYIMALLMAVVAFGSISIPDLTEMPPNKWIVTVAITCVALGIVIGFGIRELFFPHNDGDE